MLLRTAENHGKYPPAQCRSSERGGSVRTEVGGLGQILGQSSRNQGAPVVCEHAQYLDARFLEREQARRFRFGESDNVDAQMRADRLAGLPRPKLSGWGETTRGH